jgi:hypothetical protein
MIAMSFCIMAGHLALYSYGEVPSVGLNGGPSAKCGGWDSSAIGLALHKYSRGRTRVPRYPTRLPIAYARACKI